MQIIKEEFTLEDFYRNVTKEDLRDIGLKWVASERPYQPCCRQMQKRRVLCSFEKHIAHIFCIFRDAYVSCFLRGVNLKISKREFEITI